MKKIPFLILSLFLLVRFLFPLLQSPPNLSLTVEDPTRASKVELVPRENSHTSIPSISYSEEEPTVEAPKKAFGNSDEIGYTIEVFNRLNESELTQLKGIGPKIARAIVQHRTDHGDFATWDDLLKVKGIGEKKLRQILESRP